MSPLVKKFLLASLVTITGSLLLITYFANRHVTANLIDDAIDHQRIMAARLARLIEAAAVTRGTGSGILPTQVENMVDLILSIQDQAGDTDGITIYSAKGKLIYSKGSDRPLSQIDRSLIAHIRSDHSVPVLKAQTASRWDAIYRSNPELAVFTSLVADTSALNGAILGLHTNLAKRLTTAHRTALIIAGWAGMLFIAYFALMAYVVHRVSTRLTSQQRTINVRNRSLEELSRRFMETQEIERQRIARELHDSIGQCLAAIKMRLDNLLDSTEGPEFNPAKIQPITRLVQDTIDESRRIAMDVRPPLLDDLGILATLDWFIREFHTTCPDIRVTIQTSVPENVITDSLKTVIYRISQEAFQNIAKHSGAHHARIRIWQQKGSLLLRIDDDGHGFQPQQSVSVTEKQHGYGLKNMTERATLNNGTLSIRSEPGHGTTIEACWPITGKCPAAEQSSPA